MTTQSPWDDARVHAYVDGELDAETSARLEADSRRDAALAARVAQQRELSARLRAEYGPVLEEPVPQRLLTPPVHVAVLFNFGWKDVVMFVVHAKTRVR